MGWMVNPGVWRYFDGNKVLWKFGRLVEAYGTSLFDYKPPVMAQHDERGQAKGVLQAFEEWHHAECADVNGGGVRQCP